MNTQRNRRKLREVKQHREIWYLRAIQGLIDGIYNPEYVHLRYLKMKEVG